MPGIDIDPATTAQPAIPDTEKTTRAAASTIASKTAEDRFVQYTGPSKAVAAYEDNEKLPADQRRELGPGEASTAIMRPHTFAHFGVATTDTYTWDRTNNWRVNANRFTDAQLDVLLDRDGRFILVDAAGLPAKR